MKEALTILLMALVVSINAQRFSPGFSAGLVTSQVDGDTYPGYDKAGLSVSGSLSKQFSEESRWSAAFEISYIQKGSRKIPHPDKGDYASYKLNLNYAEVPVLLDYHFGLRDTSIPGRLDFSIIGGLAAGFLVQHYEEDSYGAVSGGVPFEKVDFSAILGLCYHLNRHFGISIRTEYSAFPVRKKGSSPYYQNWTYRFLKPGYYNNLLVYSLKYDF